MTYEESDYTPGEQIILHILHYIIFITVFLHLQVFDHAIPESHVTFFNVK